MGGDLRLSAVVDVHVHAGAAAMMFGLVFMLISRY